MKKFLFVLSFLFLAADVQAQTHSCDKPALTGNNNTPVALFLFAACVPVTANADGIAVELNGTVTFVTASPSGPANTAGKEAFNVSVTLPANGNHTVRTAAFTLTSTGTKQVGPFSSPFVLVLEKPAPTVAPTNHLR